MSAIAILIAPTEIGRRDLIGLKFGTLSATISRTDPGLRTRSRS
jgi:hypothetical protein